MKTLSLVFGGLATLAAGTIGWAAPADQDCKSDCVTKITTDFSGKPPFKRKVERLEAVDVAQLEVTESELEGEWVTVRTTDFRGKPPFKRRTEKLFVTDAAQLELLNEEQSKKKKRRRAKTGNSAQKRH
ncbi:MAG: hypothetical protein AB8B95_06440 [Pseudohongiellaceae bacterium]